MTARVSGTVAPLTLALAFQSKEFKCSRFSHAVELYNCNLNGIQRFLQAHSDGNNTGEARKFCRLSNALSDDPLG